MVVEKTGKTIDEAVNAALSELGCEKDDAQIEVVDEGSKGLFGLFGSKEVRVRVSYEAPQAQKPHRAEEFLTGLFEKLGVSANLSLTEDDERITVDVTGDNVGILIGRRGETLDAIQYLTNLVTNKGQEEFTRVTVDVENYRQKRKETLVALANKIAARVEKYKRNVVLEPMNPYERRIIHETLQQNPAVTTFSTGEEPNRKVVVALKGGQRRRPGGYHDGGAGRED